MRRREFLAFASAVLASRAFAREEGGVYKIGMLATLPVDRERANLDALRNRLLALGYSEGRILLSRIALLTETRTDLDRLRLNSRAAE